MFIKRELRPKCASISPAGGFLWKRPCSFSGFADVNTHLGKAIKTPETCQLFYNKKNGMNEDKQDTKMDIYRKRKREREYAFSWTLCLS